MQRLAVVIVCLLALPVPAAQAWTWPVDGPVLRTFSFDRAHPYAAGQHRGLDIGSDAGTPVLAPVTGVVSFAGTVPTGGKTVSIETPIGYTATLLHLGAIGVKRGAVVSEGSIVGSVGSSGVVDHSEPYVYFGVRVTGEDQGYVDPLPLLPSGPVVTQAPQPARVEAPAAAVEAPAASAAAPVATAEPAVVETPSEAPAAPSAESQQPVVEEVAPTEPIRPVETSRATARHVQTRPRVHHATPATADRLHEAESRPAGETVRTPRPRSSSRAEVRGERATEAADGGTLPIPLVLFGALGVVLVAATVLLGRRRMRLDA